mgnify:CR=1 FL=1
MRNKYLTKYFEENENNTDNKTIESFLKSNNIFKEAYFDINKDEITKYVNSQERVVNT